MIPAQNMACEIANDQHPAYFNEGSYKSCAAYAFQLIKAEFETQCK